MPDARRPMPGMNDFLLWQLVDSAFPAGGFAHSGGLEAAVQLGSVKDSASLRAFVHQSVAQAGRGALPLVNGAHRNPADLGELDGLCDAFLTNPVANRASRAQGQAFLSTCRRSFLIRRPLPPGLLAPLAGPHSPAPFRSFPESVIEPVARIVRAEKLAGHHAPLFGAIMNVLDVDRRNTQRLFLYLAGRGVMSAAVRLGVIGAYEAQQIQGAIGTEIDRTIERCGQLMPLEIAQTAPLIDLRQATHDRLYSRIFQS